MSPVRRYLTFANVISLVALFIALGGGTAVALNGSNTVFSDDIVNNEVRSADVRDDTLSGPGGLRGTDLAPNSVGSSEVADGAIGSGDLAPAARGARAYGLVDPTGALSRSKNASVARVEEGVYCIALAGGIDPASAVLIVGPDSNANSTSLAGDNTSVVEWDSTTTPPCPGGTLMVLTFRYLGDSVDNVGGNVDLTGDDLQADDESFVFVVP